MPRSSLNCPSATPKKSPSSSLSLKKHNNIFHRVMWAFLGFSCWLGQSFTEKTGNQEPSPPPTPLFLLNSNSNSNSLFPSISLSSSLSFASSPTFSFFLLPPPPHLSSSLPISFPHLTFLSFRLFPLLGFSFFFLTIYEEDERGCLPTPFFCVWRFQDQIQASDSPPRLSRIGEGNFCFLLLRISGFLCCFYQIFLFFYSYGVWLFSSDLFLWNWFRFFLFWMEFLVWKRGIWFDLGVINRENISFFFSFLFGFLG